MSKEPCSIGIIMDGNRRWARERNLPTLEGHRAGLDKIKEFLGWAREAGVRELIVYAFSTENWKRSAEEVSYLLKLFDFALNSWMKDILEQGVRVRFIGDRTTFTPAMQQRMKEIEAQTAKAPNGTLAIALSYGGRAEILSAVNTLLVSGREQVSEDELREVMWSAGLGDPDLIIRTGGEQRLSNFLAWQSVYSELFFTETKWPDFSHEEFTQILTQYGTRERRHGE